MRSDTGKQENPTNLANGLQLFILLYNSAALAASEVNKRYYYNTVHTRIPERWIQLCSPFQMYVP